MTHRPRRAVRPGDADRQRARQETDRSVDALHQHPGVVPDRADEDTGAAWGEAGDADDDRLRREVPPHW